ncbi:DNA-binding transcriptional regulator KdgR [Desulfosarcina widdelii]|uniref:DNA-binding transcriptional regulator KdgR n=2 Tax=Desulfosarcinaceae TaxID=3031624 RepID=A0A5K7Z9N4_9BACT|nr:DNA-binding transcriptional regulator KdgR [Desulfosarcina widdelii]
MLNRREGKPYYMISSLARGLRMIELLAENGQLTASESARMMGSSRSVAHRFLATLHKLGYVRQDERARYALSMKLFELGSRVINHSEIFTTARPFMQRLVQSHGETVSLSILDGQDMVIIDTLTGRKLFNYHSTVGSRTSASSHAMGKVILAFRNREDQEVYADAVHLDSCLPCTTNDSGAFLSELDGIRRDGYATDDEKWAVGIRCVAAPVFNHTNEPAYSIGVFGPTNRMTSVVISKLSFDLIQSCRVISKKLGSSRD